MQRELSYRHVGLGVMAAILIAAVAATSASFQASSPGSDLKPVGGAETIIELIQGQHSILWSALTGPVTQIETVGWPSTDGTHELGGALMLKRPDGNVGVVEFGEKPMSMTFDIGN